MKDCARCGHTFKQHDPNEETCSECFCEEFIDPARTKDWPFDDKLLLYLTGCIDGMAHEEQMSKFFEVEVKDIQDAMARLSERGLVSFSVK